ncbi:MAG: hypothetical protein D6820_09735 [Lentisphaerae bacterium]|nr:MAG: hypothetical protein D6820_09735 [Lentisphaerota bacterium]
MKFFHASVILAILSLVLAIPARSQNTSSPNRLMLKSEGLTLTGDLRVRYENRKLDNAGVDDARNRFRTRFRLGTGFEVQPKLKVYAGLATGTASGTSTNDTWNEASTWETGDIRLDYAYAELLNDPTNTTILVGQQKNPYVSASLLWDGDLRPTGFTVKQPLGPAFITAGYYNMRYLGDNAMGNLIGLQAGIRQKGDIGYTAALAYFHANDQYAIDMFGAATKYAYRVIDIYGDFGVKLGNDLSLGAFLEAGRNLGPDNGDTQLGGAPAGYQSEDNDTFYNVGIKSKFGTVSAKLQYFYVEGDSVFGGLSNSDPGDTGAGTVDIKGPAVSVAWEFMPKASIGMSYWKIESIERNDIEGKMFRVDLVYKF